MVGGISAAILAGGKASRFNGIIKPKIVINGEMIISRIISAIRDIFNEIIIVTNTPSEFEEFSFCKIVKDEILNSGPLGGIHAALKASSNEAVFVLAGDMPFPDRQIIMEMIDIYKSRTCDAVIPEKSNMIEPLHAIYSVSLLSAIESYLMEGGNRAVRGFIKDINTYYLNLEDTESTRQAFMNINIPTDLEHT